MDPLAYKFLGFVKEFDPAKKNGRVQCQESEAIWGADLYIYETVLKSADATVGDTIRFGVHVNKKGLPQVSSPIFKCNDMGEPLDVPEGVTWENVEDCAAEDENFLDSLKEAIEGSSKKQNDRKEARQQAKGAAKGGKGDDGISLIIFGVPEGVQRRELLGIFRQYAGFVSLRQVERKGIVFVSFETWAQAEFVMEALSGYVFDEEAPAHDQVPLEIQFSRESLGETKGKGKGKGKGKSEGKAKGGYEDSYGAKSKGKGKGDYHEVYGGKPAPIGAKSGGKDAYGKGDYGKSKGKGKEKGKGKAKADPYYW